VHRKQALLDEFAAAGRWLLPAVCPLCDDRRDVHLPLCGSCLDALPPLPEARCPRCDLPYPATEGSPHLCGDCITSPPPFAAVCALGPYSGLLKQAIGRLKYHRLPLLDQPLGQLLATTVRRRWPQYAPDLIIPVPLHPRRLRERTFNQSLLLARVLAKTLSAPVASRLLRRVRHTPAQQGLNAAERKKNLQQALRIDDKLNGRSILLVDDVMTTGATARACSRQLRLAGAVEVRVALLARAPRHLQP